MGDPAPAAGRVRPRRRRGRDRRAGPAGPVRLLTGLRYLGHCFNPVSFYYCFDPAGERVEAVVADVKNIPWGERHALCPCTGRSRGTGAGRRARQEPPRLPADGDGPDLSFRASEPGERLEVHIESRPAARARAASPSTRPSRCAAASSARPLLAGLLARYPAMSLQVVAKIYAQALRLKLKGARYFPHPEGSGRRGSSRREGRARPRRRRARCCAASAPAGSRSSRTAAAAASARRTPTCARRSRSTTRPPGAAPLHGSVGLGEAYVDGLWETDDLVALIRIAARELRQPRRPARRRRPPARRSCTGCAASSPRTPASGARRQHLRPLRPRQRPLRRLPRRADDVLLRLLPARGREPRGGAAGEARPDLRAPPARPREPPAGDRHRLGRAGDPRRRASTAAG